MAVLVSPRIPERAQSKVFRILDGLRGLAALLVVVRHSGRLLDPISFRESYLAVDLFFVISGIVIGWSYERRLLGGLSPGRFVLLRLIRLYPFYLLGCSVTVALVVAAGSSDQEPLAASILLALLFVQSFASGVVVLNPPSWSLFAELVANVAYARLLPWLTDSVLKLVVVASGGFLILVAAAAPGQGLDTGFSLQTLPAGLARVCYSFFLGVLLYRRYVSRSWRAGPEVRSNLAGIAIAALVVAILAFPVPFRLRPWYDVATVLFVFPAISFVALGYALSGWTDRAFRFLGIVSYGVYVLHAPVQAVAVQVGGTALTQYAP